MTATTAQVAKIAAELNVCQCGRFAVVKADGTKVRTGCTRTTKRLFAPGHDAKLKGILIRAGVAGEQVIREGEGNNGFTDPVKWGYSFGFGHMVEAGIKLARDKAAAKKSAKAKAEPVAAPEPEVVEAKVGRWTYKGVVLPAADGQPNFQYTDGKGEVKNALKFTLV